jgi:hypothetical protein
VAYVRHHKRYHSLIGNWPVYCGQKYNVKISNIWPTKTKVRAMEIQNKIGSFFNEWAYLWNYKTKYNLIQT